MKKRLLSLLLAVLMVCSLAVSAGAVFLPKISGNVEYQSYHDGYASFSRWAIPIWSYLHPCAEGMERVEFIPHASGVELVAEQYAMDGTLLGQKTLPVELPIFGGFFSGSDANYLVFGQKNEDHSDTAEIIRVVRYSKDWRRQSSVSLYGENTSIPFDAGCLRMTEDAAYLYVHTCHEMYSGHQANLTFCVRKSGMTVTDVRSSVMNYAYGYVSHSFNQFLALDGDRLVTLDHGDGGNTRGGYLYRHKAIGADGKFLPYFYGGSSLCGEGVQVLPFRAAEDPNNPYDYNRTGANFGGLAVTGSHYLVAGSSVDQTADGVDPDSGQRNVFLAAVPKNNLSDGAVQVRWLTNYTDTRLFTPHLVSISADRSLLLWCTGAQVHYVFLRADGTPEGGIFTGDATLSDCVPTVIDGKVWWYSTEYWTYAEHFYFTNFWENDYEDDGETPNFYCIDLANPGTVQCVEAKIAPHDHVLETKGGLAATCTAEGRTGDQVCTICGEVISPSRVIPALGHSWGGWSVTRQPTEYAEGRETRTCTRCGESQTRPVPRLTPDPTPTATTAPTPTAAPGPGEKDCPSIAFTDVDRSAKSWYHAAVDWAVTEEITNGITPTRFGPGETCTRGQVVTFLWRAMGSPEPETAQNPFTDVKSTSFYYKAVLWAAENGVTTGTSKTTFSPNEPCTRAHVVTFLWRTHDQPAAGKTNPFSDVKAGQYYTSAVLWAVAQKITNGTDATHFSPASPCTRAQIVTFLHRDLGR